VPLILDLHEAMPEFFQARFPQASNPIVRRLLRLQERASIAFASAVITVNDALGQRLIDLGVPPDKVTVLLNSPSLQLFDAAAHPRRAFAEDGIVRLVYAGALSPTYEVDVALSALARLAELRPDMAVHLEIYGRDFGERSLAADVARLGLLDRVTFHGRVPLEDVPAAIAAADIGLAPTRRNAFTDFSLSTKIFEYGAMGKPIVASRLPMIERTFPTGTVATYEPGDADDLAHRIVELVDDRVDRESRVARTDERVRELGWDREAKRYRALVDRLARGREPDADRPES
jgi:glycosyltransferase involved in cell wall biosynthesis